MATMAMPKASVTMLVRPGNEHLLDDDAHAGRGVFGFYIFFKIAVIELMAVPEGHERDEKGHDENERIKVIAHEGIEPQAPDARHNCCKGTKWPPRWSGRQ